MEGDSLMYNFTELVVMISGMMLPLTFFAWAFAKILRRELYRTPARYRRRIHGFAAGELRQKKR